MGEAFSGSATATLAATDTTSGANQTWYRVDEGTWAAYTSAVTVSAPGAHVFEYYAVDMAGNMEAVKGENFTISSTSVVAPAILFDSHDSNYPDGNVTIGFTVSNMAPVSKVEYSLDGGDYVGLDATATSVSLANLAPGEHSLWVRVTDSSNTTP